MIVSPTTGRRQAPHGMIWRATRSETASDLSHANAVRLFLQVFTIADLVHPNWKYIPDNLMNGSWWTGTKLRWSHQLNPNKRQWQIFYRPVKEGFCSRIPAHQHASQLRTGCPTRKMIRCCQEYVVTKLLIKGCNLLPHLLLKCHPKCWRKEWRILPVQQRLLRWAKGEHTHQLHMGRGMILDKKAHGINL